VAIWSAVLAAAAARQEEQPAAADGVSRLVLIVDQFEQVFTLNPDPDPDPDGEATWQAFITALCSAAASPVGPGLEPPALVVIAVRGDFWDRCAAFPELVSALQDGHFVVGPMTESELRVAITGPAEAAGLRINPALTDTILGDLRAAGADRSAGVLPLLSQAMALTWEERDGDRLTSHGYAQAGGVSRAVQTGADRVYETLSASQQALAREVLCSMTVASRNGALARRPVSREDLYSGLPGASHSDIDAVLDAFVAERLAVLDGDTAQLSHDVLLRAWPRFRGWLEEDQASWILYSQLADTAAAWHGNHDDPSFLYRGAQLAILQHAVIRWSANPARSPVLTGTQRDFLRASEGATVRSSRRRRSAFAVLALLTALAIAASGLAFSQRAAAIRQRNQAIYNQVIAEALQFDTSDTLLAARLNLAAYRIRPTQDLASRLLNTENTPLSSPVTASAGGINSVAFSPDEHTLASGSSDGIVQLWNLANPTHPRPLGYPLSASATVELVAFGPGGHTLASGSDDGIIRLWDTTDPAHPHPLGHPLNGGHGTVYSVAFSPDGRTLADGSDDGAIQLWDIADPAHPRSLGQPLSGGTGAVETVAFSPDGRTLASGDFDGMLRLWDTTDPAHAHSLVQPLARNTAGVYSVAFDPDGRMLASGSLDGAIRLWDSTDPAHPRPLGAIQPTSRSVTASVAFSPDGRTLASGSLDGAIRLWDVTDPAHPDLVGQPLTGTAAAVVSVAFSPDGHTLASGGYDGAIRLWSLPQTLLTGSAGLGNPVAFSPDGHTLASGGGGDAIRLWDTTDPGHPHPLGSTSVGRAAVVESVAFSPDGHTVASGDSDGTIQLWDIADPAHPRPLGQHLTGGTSFLLSVAFSPDGHTLASGDNDGTIQLWDIADPAHPRPLGQRLTGGTSLVASVAFSRDGHTLASGGAGGAIRLWDTTDPAHPHPLGHALAGAAADVVSVAFSPDGHTLASGDYDGAIRLWETTDPAHPHPLGQPLTVSTAALGSVAFSPDGRTLASGSLDGTTRLWNLDLEYAIQRICAAAGGLTPRQWHQYIPQLPYQPSCAR
jgi:WD40 repeat protein